MPEPLDPLLQQEVEASPVPVIEEDGLPYVASQGDMIERPWIVNSRLPGQGPMIKIAKLQARPQMRFDGLLRKRMCA